MKRRYKEQQFTDGWSESAWKSVVVKSLRMGWPTGLYRAAGRLQRSKIQYLLIASVFEDIFPAGAELAEAMAEARALDFAAVCRRQTHHGRGYTAEFCNLETAAVAAAVAEKPRLWREARRRGLWLPDRALNCFWTWLQIRPMDADVRRRVDRTPWAGMPAAMLDMHTLEGRSRRTFVTTLSGDYNTHAELGRAVRRHGWGPIRRKVHSDHAEPRRHAKQDSLF